MTEYPASIREIEEMPCPGYRSPVSGAEYHRAGQTHHLITQRGVRCASCGVEEPHLRAQAEAVRAARAERERIATEAGSYLEPKGYARVKPGDPGFAGAEEGDHIWTTPAGDAILLRFTAEAAKIRTWTRTGYELEPASVPRPAATPELLARLIALLAEGIR